MEARDSEPLVSPSLVRVRTLVSITDRGRIASQLRQIEEHLIDYIRSLLARFGFVSWCPDLRQTPYALYNAACRIIALDTFKQALVSHAYAHLAPNLSYVKDMVLLVKMYDHFVHHYLYTRYQKECRVPGSVRARDETSPGYHRRNSVHANICMLFLKLIYMFFFSLPLLASSFSRKTITLVVIASSLIRKQRRMTKPILLVALSRARRFFSSTSDLNDLASLKCSFDVLTRNATRQHKLIHASAGKNGQGNSLPSRSKLLTPHYRAICPSITLIMNSTTLFNLVSDTTSQTPKSPYFPTSISPSQAQRMRNSPTRHSTVNMVPTF